MFRLDIDFVRHFICACNFRSLGFDCFLFFLGTHRPLERDHSVLRDDFHVMAIG